MHNEVATSGSFSVVPVPDHDDPVTAAAWGRRWTMVQNTNRHGHSADDGLLQFKIIPVGYESGLNPE